MIEEQDWWPFINGVRWLVKPLRGDPLCVTEWIGLKRGDQRVFLCKQYRHYQGEEPRPLRKTDKLIGVHSGGFEFQLGDWQCYVDKNEKSRADTLLSSGSRETETTNCRKEYAKRV